MISVGKNIKNKDFYPTCSLMKFNLEKGFSVVCAQDSYRPLKQCIGVWEIDRDIINEKGNK